MSTKSISSAYGTRAGVATLGPFKGVYPYAAKNISDKQSTSEYLEYTENMWRDPCSDGGSIVTVPGFRRALAKKLGARIHSVCAFYGQYSERTALAVHCGDKLYIFKDEELSSEPVIISGIADKKCSLVPLRSSLLVFDGVKPKVIVESGEGEYSCFSDELGTVYIPTVYREGGEGEPRNLLSHRAYEERIAPSAGALRGTQSLTCSYDHAEKTCTVTGISTKDTFVYIPSKITYNEEEYVVTGIADSAFYANINIETLIVGADVSVGKRAFEYCTGLKFAAFERPTGTRSVTIGERAFFKAPIKTLYLGYAALGGGGSALTISDKAFGNDTATGLEIFDTEVHFGGTSEEFSAMTGASYVCSATYSGLGLGEAFDGEFAFYHVPVLGGVRRVESVTLNGRTLSFGAVTRNTTNPETVRFIIAYAPKGDAIAGERLKIRCLMTSRSLVTSWGENETVEAVCGCNIAVPYDGRLFLTGNPLLPNTVFYTEVPLDGESVAAHPLYFAEGNVFDDGVSDEENADMLASPSALIVIKSGRGGVYYHRAADKNGKRVYPCETGAVSVGAVGAGCSAFFNGYPCFIGESGIYLIKGGISSEKKVYAIDRTDPNIKEAICRGIETGNLSLGSFCGYLALCADGEIYLGDPVSLVDGVFPCWYKLSDIGVYDGDAEEYIPVTEKLRIGGQLIDPTEIELYALLGNEYAALTFPDEEALLGCLDGENCTGEVFESELYTRSDTGEYSSLGVGSVTVGAFKWLSRRSDKTLYCVCERSGGRCGGVFDPCALVAESGGRQMFATEGGEICIFNTDKRGVTVYRYDTDYSERDERYGKYVEYAGRRYPLSICEPGKLYCFGKPCESELYSDAVTEQSIGSFGVLKFVFEPSADGSDGKCYPLCPSERETDKNAIHSAFYSFDGRAIRAVLVTGRHACGESGCAKTTVRGSVILSAPVLENSAFTASCRTDVGDMEPISRVYASRMDMSATDFGNMSFCLDGDGMFCVLGEKKRGYIFKQYCFANRGIYQPFGICGLTYRYTRSAYKGQ